MIPYPQAVPLRKNTTMIQPMISAAAMRRRSRVLGDMGMVEPPEILKKKKIQAIPSNARYRTTNATQYTTAFTIVNGMPIFENSQNVIVWCDRFSAF